MMLTKAQRKALKAVFDRGPLKDVSQPSANYDYWYRCPNAYLSYRAFRRTVSPGSGCIMVPWKGMWLGIEPDGYTHS